MSKFEILTTTRRTLLGRRSDRRIVGEPTWQALRAWKDAGDVEAPGIEWLRIAVADALDEIDRRGA